MSLGQYRFIVGTSDDGNSVKTFLRRRCGLSARSLTVIKYDGGRISSDDRELRAHDILSKGMVIKVVLPQERCDVVPIKGEPDILFEDDRLLIVNKPADMPVHPTKVHQLDTLANIVSFYQQSKGERYTFRSLNRLDKDTSGCVMIAKDRIAYSLVLPTVEKEYIAVCEGHIAEAGVIDAPIALASDSKIKRVVSGDGDRAVTHYEPIRYSDQHTVCRVWLETGRTHQIRCHMSAVGLPLAGDDLYGGSLEHISRQALHCRRVSFLHPDTGEKIVLTADIPSDIQQFMDP